jgi:alpha-D-xyloside xylohydrolase
MPYWTTDIGGFFRPGRGQYTDAKYHDILTRWFQWGVFNPIFRIHGYQTETEPWKYGDTVMNNMRSMMNLRYRLMPYIYSEAWQVSKNGSTMMRPLVMDFSNDAKAVEQSYQYMFGKALLVAPVTAPTDTWDVYLPKSSAWYDFRTGKSFNGGQTISTAAPADKIPVFVKAGAVIPFGPEVQYAAEKKWDDLEIRIYEGANGEFILYEDEYDNYNYEKGAYSTITFSWNDIKKELSISDRKGTFPGMLTNRKFNIVMIRSKNIEANNQEKNIKEIVYKGKQIIIKIP